MHENVKTLSQFIKKISVYIGPFNSNWPFKGVSMDFMTFLPLWQEEATTLVVVNRFFKLAKFESTKINATRTKITKLFFNM